MSGLGHSSTSFRCLIVIATFFALVLCAAVRASTAQTTKPADQVDHVTQDMLKELEASATTAPAGATTALP